MRSAIILGSGPAAAGVALALGRDSRIEITVVDIGTTLEAEHALAVGRLHDSTPDRWASDDLATVSTQPIDRSGGLPEKRSYGSAFPFADAGQLTGIEPDSGVNRSIVTSAYGGFSNIWGAQVMPFTEANFAAWPISRAQMEPHYRRILQHIPFSGIRDDLEGEFPLFHPEAPLPPLAARTRKTLRRYERHRPRLHRLGVRMGQARLAVRSPDCIECGLCMTGCPYGLIYSASQTFDDLRRRSEVRYLGGFRAEQILDGADSAQVRATHLATGRHETLTADRIFVACGAFGSTRLAMSSLNLYHQPRTMGESVQFTLPFVSMAPVPDPRTAPGFTLNQFNMTVDTDGRGNNISQLHFYAFNEAFVNGLPAALAGRPTNPITTGLLQRLSVALGYLPSWESPSLRVWLEARGSAGSVLRVAREPTEWLRNSMLKRVLATVARSSRYLDLWPVLPKLMLAPGAKSYHWGGSFPHSSDPRAGSDLLGRVHPWERVHLVDASVFPTVPATTFTLTIMANAHRIADGVLRLEA